MRALTLLLCLGCFGTAARSAPHDADELRVRIAFLLTFAKFTHWPEDAIANRDRFHICVAGDDLLAESLQELTRGRTVRSLPILAVDARTPNDLKGCHLAFIGTGSGRAAAHLRTIAGLPVLTVSTAAGFHDQGGMIELFLKDNRMRFSVSAKAVESSGLRISADLQALASTR